MQVPAFHNSDDRYDRFYDADDDDYNDDDDDDDDDRGYHLSSNEPDTNFSTQPLNPKLPNYFTGSDPLTLNTDDHDDDHDDEEYYGDDNDDDPPRTTCMFNTLSCTSSKTNFGNCRTNSARTRKL